MAIFMKIDGIQGNASAKNYQGWVALHSVNFMIDRHVSMPIGQPHDRTQSLPIFSEIMLTKTLDDSSNDFFEHACTGKNIRQAEIHICSSGDALVSYAKYHLQNLIIKQYHTHTSEHGLPGESIEINFTKLQLTYIGKDESNASKSPKITGFDLETAEMM